MFLAAYVIVAAFHIVCSLAKYVSATVLAATFVR
jgi:hypothetical protein